MIVNTGYNPLLYQRININLSAKEKADGFFSLPEKSVPEQKEHVTTNIWGEFSNDYSIRNASFKEIQEISTKLYEAGQISLLEHGILTFEPMFGPPRALKVNMHMTSFNADDRKDWIAEYEQRAQRDLKIGNSMGYAHKQKIIEILKRLL